MNINENYGNIQMPSQIADSFQNSYQHDYDNENCYQSHLVRDDTQFNLDSSIQDTFLDNINQLNIGKQKIQDSKVIQQPQIALNRNTIKKSLLADQSVVQSIQIINSSSQPVLVSLESIFMVSCRGQFGLSEVYLDGWEKVQLDFQIKRGQQQFGDVFQTITLQSRFQNNLVNKKVNKKKYYISVQIKFILPKISLKYQGCSDIVSIFTNKISVNKIAKNKFNEHQIEFSVGKIDRFQCTITTKGGINVFPNQLILYEGEYRKLTLRYKDKEKNKGVLVIRAKNANVNFVMSIQLL